MPLPTSLRLAALPLESTTSSVCPHEKEGAPHGTKRTSTTKTIKNKNRSRPRFTRKQKKKKASRPILSVTRAALEVSLPYCLCSVLCSPPVPNETAQTGDSSNNRSARPSLLQPHFDPQPSHGSLPKRPLGTSLLVEQTAHVPREAKTPTTLDKEAPPVRVRS